MEGIISKEFFEIQGVYLALGCHKLNGEQWVKQCIGKILHITHSQWIFRKFILHDQKRMAEKEGHEGNNGKNGKSVGH